MCPHMLIYLLQQLQLPLLLNPTSMNTILRNRPPFLNTQIKRFLNATIIMQNETPKVRRIVTVDRELDPSLQECPNRDFAYMIETS
jgi:hypothetical protein